MENTVRPGFPAGEICAQQQRHHLHTHHNIRSHARCAAEHSAERGTRRDISVLLRGVSPYRNKEGQPDAQCAQSGSRAREDWQSTDADLEPNPARFMPVPCFPSLGARDRFRQQRNRNRNRCVCVFVCVCAEKLTSVYMYSTANIPPPPLKVQLHENTKPSVLVST